MTQIGWFSRSLISALCVFVASCTLVEYPLAANEPAQVWTAETNVEELEDSRFVVFKTSLYTAWINKDTHTCERISMMVRRSDLRSTHDTSRRWWSHPEMEDFTLEAEDYVGSGFDRGHLRAIAWSRGSEDWPLVNCTAVVVPEVPSLNRGAIRDFEQEVTGIVREYGWAEVYITIHSEDAGLLMTTADEDHLIPTKFTYQVIYPNGSLIKEFENASTTEATD